MLWGVNLGVLGFSIKWSLDNVHPDQLRVAFDSVNPIKVCIVAAINMLVVGAFACRLSVLLNCRMGDALSVTILGSGLNGMLPFRLGDLVRVYYAKKFYDISAAKLAAVSILEKFFDLSALAVLVTVVVFLDGKNLIGLSFLGMILVTVFVSIVGIMVFLRYAHVAGLFFGFSKRLAHAVDTMQRNMRVNRRVEVALITVVMWAIYIGTIYVGLVFFLQEYSIFFIDAVAILLIVAFAIAIPGAPAGLGIFEAGVVAYLKSVHSIGNEQALAAALLLHVAIFLPGICLCLFLILKPRDYQTHHR